MTTRLHLLDRRRSGRFGLRTESVYEERCLHSFCDPNLEMACRCLRCGLRHFIFWALGGVELGRLGQILYWDRRSSRIVFRPSFGVSIKTTRGVRRHDYTEVSPRNGYHFFHLRVVVVFLSQFLRASYLQQCTGPITSNSRVPRHLYSGLRADFHPMETV